MNSDNSRLNTLLPVQTTAELEPAPLVPARGSPPPPEPLKKVLSIMRGRWAWALALAGMTGLVGAITGYLVGQYNLYYTSTGLIQVIAQPERTLYTIVENERVANFDYSINTQVQKVQQPRVLRAASNHPDVRKLDHDGYPDLVGYLRDRLEVSRGDKDELIWVRFTDRDPRAAYAACTAIVRAYWDLEGERATKDSSDRRRRLEDNRRDYRNRLEEHRQQRARITAQFKAPKLESLHARKLEEALDLKKRVEQLRLHISLAGVDVAALDAEMAADARRSPSDGAPQDPARQPSTGDEPPPDPVTPEAVAEFDDRMNRLIIERRLLQDDLTAMAAELGPRHRQVRAKQASLRDKERQIEQHLRHVREKGLASLPVNPDALQSPEQLTIQYRETRALYDLAAEEVEALNSAITELERIDHAIEATEANLAGIQNELEKLKIEEGSIQRVAISSEPEMPTQPSWDKRKLLTVAGLLLGSGFGFGAVLLVGLADRRLRSLDDAHESFTTTPVLGILPTLPADLSDPDQAALAAHCVHQIRTLLQIGPESQGRRVFTITSPSPQDGKTSLVLGLGLSFAASGARTLLIDCDLGFGGLTHRLDRQIHRRIGQVLLREGAIAAHQLDEALHLSRESGRLIGQTLIDLGYATHEEVDHALASQEIQTVGLLDAICGDPLEQCATETGTDNLHLLPIGGAGAEHVARLSPSAIRRLLDQARAGFDVVLVDTGSVLGSLEASHMAVESDGVVLVMSRGGQRELAEQALDHLYTLGARVAGLVFNRAAGRDVEVVAERSVSSVMPRASENGHRKRAEGGSRMGPLAGAVAGAAPGTR